MLAVCAVTAYYELLEQCQIQEKLEGERVNAEDNKKNHRTTELKVILSAESRYILTENSYAMYVHTQNVSDSVMHSFI